MVAKILSSVGGIFLVLGWLWAFSRLVKAIVNDKESKIEGIRENGYNICFLEIFRSTGTYVM